MIRPIFANKFKVKNKIILDEDRHPRPPSLDKIDEEPMRIIKTKKTHRDNKASKSYVK